MDSDTKIEPTDISDDTLKDWQSLVNIVAELVHVPAGLIMRIVDEEIEVFVSSQSEGNPYQPGSKEHLCGSGLYCETVIQSQEQLLVPNALADEEWRNNPDVKLNMISYLGFPITLPDGKPFGTICVLDTKENSYSDTYVQLLRRLRDHIQRQLELIFMNQALGRENARLSDYISEIKTLRGIIPICAWCKKVREDEDYWKSVESYITHHTEARFTHSICPDCLEKQFVECTE